MGDLYAYRVTFRISCYVIYFTTHIGIAFELSLIGLKRLTPSSSQGLSFCSLTKCVVMSFKVPSYEKISIVRVKWHTLKGNEQNENRHLLNISLSFFHR